MDQQLQQLKKELDKIKEEIKILRERRIHQTMILPDAIKMRAIGEGVRFVRTGVAADLPTAGEEPLQGAAVYFDETNNKWYIWNRTSGAWVSTTLS